MEQPVMETPDGPSTEIRFAASVAGFGMLLGDSPHFGDYALKGVIGLAERGQGYDPRGYRGEFIRLVETVRDLRPSRSPKNGFSSTTPLHLLANRSARGADQQAVRGRGR